VERRYNGAMRPRALPLFLTLLVVGIASFSGAGNAPPTPGADELLSDVRALSAPVMDGRGSGREGAERAAQYIVERLESLGGPAGGVRRPFRRWFGIGSRPRAGADAMLSSLEPQAAALEVGRDWLPHGGSLPGDVAGELVYVGDGGETGNDPYARVDLRGKIALALEGRPAGGASAPSRPGQLVAAAA